jgi:soluble lytic murein transglycosylase-like protein
VAQDLHFRAVAFAAGLCLNAACSAHAISGETSKSLCFASAADRSGIPEGLLRAVAKVESNFRPDAVHYNTDGTHDVGVMQINSSHFAVLEAQFHITEQILLERPCVNIYVGARILGSFLQQYRGTWRGVGSYGAGISATKEGARRSYATLVARALAKGGYRSQVSVATPPEHRMLVIE